MTNHNPVPTYKPCEEIATLDILPVFTKPRRVCCTLPDPRMEGTEPLDTHEPDERVEQIAKSIATWALRSLVMLVVGSVLGYAIVAQWLV